VDIPPEDWRALLPDLRQVFARGQDEDHDGLTPGFLEGVRHQRLVRGRAPRHRGVCLGQVEGVRGARGGVVLRLLAPVRRGQGVVFDQGDPEGDEQGGTVYGVYDAAAAGAGEAGARRGRGGRGENSGGGGGRRQREQQQRGGGGGGGGAELADGAAEEGRVVELVFGDGQVDVRRLRVGIYFWRRGLRGIRYMERDLSAPPATHQPKASQLSTRTNPNHSSKRPKTHQPGDLIWRNKDPGLEGRLRSSYDSISAAAARKLPVAVSVGGRLGEPLVLEVWDEAGRRGRAETAAVLQVRCRSVVAWV
jgi:hypothetical protein